MSLFPLYTSLNNKCVVVIGGGDIAQRKVKLILPTGAHIRVVAPSFNAALIALQHDQKIELIHQPFDPAFLVDAWLVIAATNQTTINVSVAQAAQARKIFVNVVDNPVLSSVQIPAIIDRSPLMIAVSSSGAAPMIARHIRERIESLVDSATGQLTALCQSYRPLILQQRPCLSERRQFYEWLIRGPVLEHLRNGDEESAAQCLEDALLHESTTPTGHEVRITLTSNNPDDITLRALRALNQADSLFIDDRIHHDILDLARRDADQTRFTVTGSDPNAAIPDFIRKQVALQVEAGRMAVVLITRLVSDIPDVQTSVDHVIS